MRKKSSFLQWIKFILPSIFPVPLKLKEMWYVLSSDAKYCSELLVRLCECCQEINFPSYFISRLEKYKAELMYLFDRQVDGYTLPQVAVCLKDSIAYLIYNLSWLVCIPVLFIWSHGDGMLGVFYWTSKKPDKERKESEESWTLIRLSTCQQLHFRSKMLLMCKNCSPSQ